MCVSVHPSVCGRVGVDGPQVSFLPNIKLFDNTESASLTPRQDPNVNFQPYSSGLLLKTPGLTPRQPGVCVPARTGEGSLAPVLARSHAGGAGF